MSILNTINNTVKFIGEYFASTTCRTSSLTNEINDAVVWSNCNDEITKNALQNLF